MTLETVLARLYRSEINASIAWFWDEGWALRLGDGINGWKASTVILCPTGDPTRHRSVEDVQRGLAEVAAWLDENARKGWPDSEYARTPW